MTNERNLKVKELVNHITDVILNGTVDMYLYVGSILTDIDYNILLEKYLNDVSEVNEFRATIKNIMLGHNVFNNRNVEIELPKNGEKVLLGDLIAKKFTVILEDGSEDSYTIFNDLFGYIQMKEFLNDCYS